MDIATLAASMAILHGFQAILARCPSASDRKHLIMTARETGAISDPETRLLIEAHQLETA